MSPQTEHFGSIATSLITILFVLGLILPIFGIVSAIWPIWREMKYADKRDVVMKDVYAKYTPLINAAKAANDTDGENMLHEAQARALAAKDKTGKAISDVGGLNFNWQSILARDELRKLTKSLAWVCAGLVCGTAASIWSFLGSL